LQDVNNRIYPDLPGFEILSELGRGGIATVYLAIQQSLDRRVALKVMSPLLAMETDYSERFVREGRLVAKLNHPHIITVYDIGVQQHQLYIAMEHIPGGNLRSKLPLHQGDANWALSVAGQIARALGYAHRNGIIHRDVKPENILFREDNVAVLTDFGIAKTISSTTNLTQAGAIVGTPKYMSPEQTDGLGNDPGTDVYSLGVILYEMLTGSVPYDSENSMAILYAHVHSPIPRLPDRLADLQPLLDSMLAKDPADRPANCEQLAELIRITRRERHIAQRETPQQDGQDDDAADTTPAPAAEPSPTSTATTAPGTPRRWPRTLGAAAAIAGILIAMTVWLTNSPPEPQVAPPAPEVPPKTDTVLGPPAETETPADTESSDQRRQQILTSFLADDNVTPPVATPPTATSPAVSEQPAPDPRIAKLLDQARDAVVREQLFRPEDDNAIAYYQEVLQIAPRNRRAKRGLLTVADLLHEQAGQYQLNGDQDLALELVSIGLTAAPGHDALLELQRAIEASINANSSFAKAEKLYHGIDGPMDRVRAAFFYRQSAERGHLLAMNAHGVNLVDGVGAVADEAAAMEWFRQSADGGNPEAMHNLALGYLFGPAPEPGRALPWAEQSSRQDYRPAFMVMSWMYTTGTGADVNSVKAMRWDFAGMFNPIDDSLGAQYRIARKWQRQFLDAYVRATDTGSDYIRSERRFETLNQ